MTFTEAAVQVLRLVGKPLHYRKITEIAIERNLLSHVGKTPEITMSSRLATMVKKDRGDAPIIKVKPGVFGLRDFPAEVLQAAQSESGHDYDLPQEEAESGETARAAAEAPEVDEEADTVETARRPSHKLPGADVFPEEEDDDEPILAKLDEEEGARTEGKRSRRRRRRKRKGGGERRPEEREPQAEASAPSSGGGRRSQVRGNWDRPSAQGEAVAQDLADAVESVLAGNKRRPMSHARLADALIRRGRLSGDAEGLAPTVAAAVFGDDARRRFAAERTRFRTVTGGVALTDWDLPGEAVRVEQDARRAAERQREAVHRAFMRRLSEMPATGFMQLIAAWLNAEGVSSLRGVRPPSKSGYHLAGTLRRGPQETGVAVAIWRDGTPVGREHVIEVRGGLHHYGNASVAWLLTTGRAQSGAWEEASVPGQPPCIIYDGASLASAMERMGVGLRRLSIPISTIDFELLETLSPRRASGEASASGAEAKQSRRRQEPSEEPGEDVESGEEDAAAASGNGSESRGRSRRRSRNRGGRRAEAQTDESAPAESTSDESVAGEANASAADEQDDDENTSIDQEVASADEEQDRNEGDAAMSATAHEHGEVMDAAVSLADSASPEITKESDEADPR